MLIQNHELDVFYPILIRLDFILYESFFKYQLVCSHDLQHYCQLWQDLAFWQRKIQMAISFIYYDMVLKLLLWVCWSQNQMSKSVYLARRGHYLVWPSFFDLIHTLNSIWYFYSLFCKNLLLKAKYCLLCWFNSSV